MSIVINTPTSNIGRALASRLLEQKHSTYAEKIVCDVSPNPAGS
jgi:hypothetical protein